MKPRPRPLLALCALLLLLAAPIAAIAFASAWPATGGNPPVARLRAGGR